MTDSTYDYIIVGGGTAGLVLAARLSEDPAVQVLVLEAGDDQTADPRIAVPAMWPTLLGTSANWGFRTTSQPGLGGRELPFTQGRLLGGSSAINGMSFTPTSQANIDAWAKLGNEGWEWDKFVDSFAKSYTSPAGSGGGPIKLSVPDDPENQWAGLWYETLNGLGYPGDGDAFTGNVCGTFINTDSIDPASRQRSYAGNAYLGPALDRANLTILTQASVDRVIFDTSGPGDVRADGVQYYSARDGETRTAKAGREVILAAGAVNSPKILELSGVGDPALLERLGIDVVVDNEHVGENLQNHIMCGVSFEVREGLGTMDPIVRQEQAALGAAMEAYGRQSGPLASSGTNAVAQLPFPGIQTDEGRADLARLLAETVMSPPETATSKTTTAFAKAHEDFVRSVLASPDEASACYLSFPGFAWFQPDGTMAPPPGENYFSVALLLAHPLSRGSVHITSSSASRDPAQVAIDPRHLTHPLDVEVLARHLGVLGAITASEPLASRLRTEGRRNPGAPSRLADLEQAREYIRKTAVGANHPTGTCSMMPRELGGVVGADLRVYGCSNLRVCDASIMPILPRANLLATVYGVAEHAAGLIRGARRA